MPRPFLTARWQYLLFFSYRCPSALLEPHVPRGTTLDQWHGDTFVSLAAFLFDDTRVLGVPFIGHRTFEEVNLRFYVRRKMPGGEARRAVVFMRELVPRRAIAWVARAVYNEPYLAVPMSHRIDVSAVSGGSIDYGWRYRGREFRAAATVSGQPEASATGSLAEFITEHYWGYTAQRDGGTLEYRVEHPRWPVWHPQTHRVEGDFAELYGQEFGRILAGKPDSVLAAEGSAVSVHGGIRI